MFSPLKSFYLNDTVFNFNVTTCGKALWVLNIIAIWLINLKVINSMSVNYIVKDDRKSATVLTI
jgi:hypothetical protein